MENLFLCFIRKNSDDKFHDLFLEVENIFAHQKKSLKCHELLDVAPIVIILKHIRQNCILKYQFFNVFRLSISKVN